LKLVIEWASSTRPEIEKSRVEDTMKLAILDCFGGSVENAEKAYKNHLLHSKYFRTDWAYASYSGFRATKGLITDREYGEFTYKASFIER
jgi:hypothetical protein